MRKRAATGDSVSITGDVARSGKFAPSHSTLLPSPYSDEDEGDDEKVDLNLANRASLERLGEFFLNGSVDGNMVENLGLAMLRQAMYLSQRRRGQKPRRFRLTVNTPGGSVESGLMMGHIMARIRRDYGTSVDIYVAGLAASMGLGLLQFADRRYMDRFSQVMMHDPMLSYSGGTTWDVRGMDDRKSYLDITRNHLAELLAYRNTAGHNSSAFWMDYFFAGRDRYLGAAEAVELGLADEITNTYVCGHTYEDDTNGQCEPASGPAER